MHIGDNLGAKTGEAKKKEGGYDVISKGNDAKWIQHWALPQNEDHAPSPTYLVPVLLLKRTGKGRTLGRKQVKKKADRILLAKLPVYNTPTSDPPIELLKIDPRSARDFELMSPT